MPQIDLTVALTSAMLVDSFTVLRLTETVGTNGRSSTSTVTFSPVYGTVMPDEPAELEMNSDRTATRKTISIVTQFRLQASTPSCQPDIVQWGGDNFKVTKVSDVSQFGPGFVEARAESIDSQDLPPAPKIARPLIG